MPLYGVFRFCVIFYSRLFFDTVFRLFYGATQTDPDRFGSCASYSDSLISLIYSMAVFSTKSFGLFSKKKPFFLLLFSPFFKTFFEVSFVVYWQNPHILWTRDRLVRFLNKLESGVVFFSAGCQSASSFQLPANCSFPKSSCQFVAYILKPDQICFISKLFHFMGQSTIYVAV